MSCFLFLYSLSLSHTHTHNHKTVRMRLEALLHKAKDHVEGLRKRESGLPEDVSALICFHLVFSEERTESQRLAALDRLLASLPDDQQQGNTAQPTTDGDESSKNSNGTTTTTTAASSEGGEEGEEDDDADDETKAAVEVRLSPRLGQLMEQAIVAFPDDIKDAAARLDTRPLAPPCIANTSFLQHCALLRYALRSGSSPDALQHLLAFPFAETVFVLCYLVKHALVAPQFLRALLHPALRHGCDLLLALVLNRALGISTLIHNTCDALRFVPAVTEAHASRVLERIGSLYPNSTSMTQHILLQNRLLAPLLLTLIVDSLHPGADVVIRLHHVRPHFTGFAAWLRSNAASAQASALRQRLHALLGDRRVLASWSARVLLLRTFAAVVNSECLPLTRDDVQPLLAFVTTTLQGLVPEPPRQQEKRAGTADSSVARTAGHDATKEAVESCVGAVFLCGATSFLDSASAMEQFGSCMGLALTIANSTTADAGSDADNDAGGSRADDSNAGNGGERSSACARVVLLLMFLVEQELAHVTALARAMLNLDTDAKVRGCETENW